MVQQYKGHSPGGGVVFLLSGTKPISNGGRNISLGKDFPTVMSCAKNHDIERRRAVVKLPRAREKEREEDTV